jgi:hypothetical protein
VRRQDLRTKVCLDDAPHASFSVQFLDKGRLHRLLRSADDRQTSPPRVDAANLADLIRERGPYAFAIVEQVGARPGQGVSSMFRFGQAHGTILGVIGALAIPVRYVSPAKWKKALSLNSDGETSRARAIETWPAQAELFARKRDHSRAEAALIGLYGVGTR